MVLFSGKLYLGKLNNYADQLVSYLKKIEGVNNPEKSVLIAAGVGMAVGAIVVASLMRRRD